MYVFYKKLSRNLTFVLWRIQRQVELPSLKRRIQVIINEYERKRRVSLSCVNSVTSSDGEVGEHFCCDNVDLLSDHLIKLKNLIESESTVTLYNYLVDYMRLVEDKILIINESELIVTSSSL